MHYQFSTGVSVSGAARAASTPPVLEAAAPTEALRPNWLLEGLPSSVEEALALRKLGLPDPQVLIVLQTEAESPALALDHASDQEVHPTMPSRSLSHGAVAPGSAAAVAWAAGAVPSMPLHVRAVLSSAGLHEWGAAFASACA